MQPIIDKQKDYGTRFDEMQRLCDINKKASEDNDTRLMRLLKQTANYEEISKKISDSDAARRMFESKVNNELANVKTNGEMNKTSISYI